MICSFYTLFQFGHKMDLRQETIDRIRNGSPDDKWHRRIVEYSGPFYDELSGAIPSIMEEDSISNYKDGWYYDVADEFFFRVEGGEICNPYGPAMISEYLINWLGSIEHGPSALHRIDGAYWIVGERQVTIDEWLAISDLTTAEKVQIKMVWG